MANVAVSNCFTVDLMALKNTEPTLDSALNGFIGVGANPPTMLLSL